MSSIRLTIPFVALLAASGCARPAEGADATARTTARSEYSVYDVGGAWRDQTGATRSLASLGGRPRVVAMIYTHCAASCPIAVANMKRIEAATSPGVGLVLVSIDPDRDTPGRLAQFAAHTGLSPQRWTLLNGGDDDVRALAATLGVRVRRLSPTELAHSNTLTLLDADGRVVHQQTGFESTDETIAAARAVSAERGAR